MLAEAFPGHSYRSRIVLVDRSRERAFCSNRRQLRASHGHRAVSGSIRSSLKDSKQGEEACIPSTAWGLSKNVPTER